MVRLRKITDAGDSAFSGLMSLYEESFPLEERRDRAQLEEMLREEKRMVFNAVEMDGRTVGLFVYWNFDGFHYLEHLAVDPSLRNHRIGQQVLDWVKANLDGFRILEVEPAESEITSRRIAYYSRNGYSVLDKTYIQPSYREGGNGCPLWIMASCGEMDRKQLAGMEEDIRRHVYYRMR